MTVCVIGNLLFKAYVYAGFSLLSCGEISKGGSHRCRPLSLFYFGTMCPGLVNIIKLFFGILYAVDVKDFLELAHNAPYVFLWTAAVLHHSHNDISPTSVIALFIRFDAGHFSPFWWQGVSLPATAHGLHWTQVSGLCSQLCLIYGISLIARPAL